jgi:transcriptional regulator with XRE-family HTH domain
MVEKTNKHQDFADRLNAEMDKKKLSVKDLSLACDVTYEMARRYTLGTAKPRDEKMAKIANWLGVAPAWLDYGHGDNQVPSPIASLQQPATNGDDDEFKNLTEDEKRLIRTFRQYPSVESQNMLLVFEMRLKELQEHYKEYFKSIGGKI